MDRWKIVWSDADVTHEEQFSTGDAVLERVLRLHAQEKELRPVVEVMRVPGDSPSLSIAVGHDETVLTFEESSEPPYFISIGNIDRIGTSPMFVHGGQGIEHLGRNIVQWDSGMNALVRFLQTEKMPNTVEWEKL